MPSTASLALDGVNDTLSCASHADLVITGDMTIEFWVKPANWWTDRQVIGGQDRSAGSGATVYQVIFGSYALSVRYLVGYAGFSTQEKTVDTTGLTDNTWHHFAFTRAGTSVNGYIDGVVNGSTLTLTSTPVDSGTGFVFGKNVFDNYLNGKLDEIRIWNVARTATEIADYYDIKASGSETGLVACWHIDEGSGTTTADAAGTAQTLTINGATWDTGDYPTLTDAGGAASALILPPAYRHQNLLAR